MNVGQTLGSFPLVGGVRLSLGAPYILIRSMQGTGTNHVPATLTSVAEGLAAPQGSESSGSGPEAVPSKKNTQGTRQCLGVLPWGL